MDLKFTCFNEILSSKLCQSLGLLTITVVKQWSQLVCQNIRDYIQSVPHGDESRNIRYLI